MSNNSTNMQKQEIVKWAIEDSSIEPIWYTIDLHNE